MQSETIHAAPPSALAFKTAPLTQLAGDCSQAIVAEARDGFGNPSLVVSNTAVTLSTTSSQGAFYSNASCTSAITQTTISAGTNSTTFYYRDTRTGSPTLTASNPGLSAPTQPATIDPAAPAKLSFVTAPQTLTAGNCSAIATIEVRDSFNNPSPVAAATTVSLSSSSMTMGFDSDPACAASVTSVAIPTGATQASFYFAEPTAGTPTLIASSAGLTNGTQSETIKIGAAAKLAFTNPPRTVTAGSCSAALTVQQQDAPGNGVPFTAATPIAVSTSSTTAVLYSDPACTTAVTQITVAAGQSSGSLYFEDTKAGPWGVTATVAGLTPASQTVTVAAAPAVSLAILTPPQTMLAGTCSNAVTLEAYDSLGNPVLAPDGGTPVALSSTAPTTQFFLASDCTSPASSVTIDGGASQGTFYFQDPKAGTPTLTATMSGLPPATQMETLLVGPPAKLAFITPPQTVSVSTCSALVTVELEDQAGNASPLTTDLTIALADSSAGAALFSDYTCATPLTGLTFDAGVTSGSLYFQDPNLGTSTLTAGASMLAGGAQQETIVTPGAPVAVAFANPPLPLEASACSDVLVIALKDQNGYSAPASAATDLGLSASTNTVTFHADGTCGPTVTKVTVAPGDYRALFHFRDLAAQTVRLTAAGPGLDAGTQDEVTTCPLAMDGAACDDNNLCNGHETCVGGVCTPASSPLSCDDNDPCTVDSCDPITGCSHQVTAGCCRSPAIAQPNLSAAVGVPYWIGTGGRASLIKGTGPIHWSACDSPPAGLRVDATTGEVDWIPLVAGPADLCLKATGPCGEDTIRFTVQVTAMAPTAPVAALTVTPDQLMAGGTVAGDASASMGTAPLSFEWTWGDGTALGTGATANHAFALAGSYPVKVTVYDTVGQSAEASHRVFVTGPGCMSPPAAQIAADKLTGDNSLTATFHDDVTPAVPGAIYWWDFGDGSSAYGMEATHTFGAGAYRVRLQVSAGGCTSEDSVEVRVTSSGRQPPRCALSADPSGGRAPLHVTFSAVFGSSAGTITSAAYSFSDGFSADALQHGGQVTRTLDAPGSLVASLVVTDDAGLACHTAVEARASSNDGLFPPVIVSVPQASVKCGEAYHYDDDNTPLATGSAPITWSLGKSAGGAGAPAGMTIDATTGQLQWTPDKKTRGPIRVTVVATNAAGSTEQDFLVQVDCGKASGCGCGNLDLAPALLGLSALLMLRRRRVR